MWLVQFLRGFSGFNKAGSRKDPSLNSSYLSSSYWLGLHYKVDMLQLYWGRLWVNKIQSAPMTSIQPPKPLTHMQWKRTSKLHFCWTSLPLWWWWWWWKVLNDAQDWLKEDSDFGGERCCSCGLAMRLILNYFNFPLTNISAFYF